MIKFPSRMFPAWILSMCVVFFTLGFLSNFFTTFFEILILAFFLQIFVSLFIFRLLGRSRALFVSQPLGFALVLTLLLVLTISLAGMFEMAGQFPSLFDVGYFLLDEGQNIPFAAGGLLAAPMLFWIRHMILQNHFSKTRLFHFLDDVAVGILVAGLFFAIYLVFASIFNRPAFDVDDIFFDTDGLLWRTRFTTDQYQDYYYRSVHPFVLLIIRPLVLFFSFFLKGDRFSAAILLVSFSGALCVFLAWYFVRQVTGNSLYAVLISSLLGGAAAHLVFGSLIETYIFLAAVMMVFIVLLLRKSSLFTLVLIGLVSFGITITNFIQTAVAFFFVRRDFKQWVKYGLIVSVLVIPLTLLNNLIYPDSQPYFFIPSSLGAEVDNTFAPSLNRAKAVVRVMFLHSVVAPQPLILDEEIPFLKVWIFKADPMRLGEYETGLGTSIALMWLVLLVFGGILFLKNIKNRDNQYAFSFILILLFNFVLHLRYGKDLFLYSTNWTYAIILFLALAWKEVAGKRWFQVLLLVFISLLILNNSALLFTMLRVSALHIK